MSSSIQLPGFLRSWLDNWGEELRKDLRDVLSSEQGVRLSWDWLWLRSSSCRPSHQHHQQPFRLGTDCSGVESPVHALKALDIAFQHLFSCECASAPRAVIQANTPPEIALFQDVRSPTDDVPFVDIYVTGFDCKPFSMLHGGTQLLEEPRAQIFFSVVKRIQQHQPPCFVLENVGGISRCMSSVLALLKQVGYVVCVECLNPLDLGEPLNRPRYYFLGVRSDVALLTETEAQAFFGRVWSRLKQRRQGRAMVRLANRMLPNNHEYVLERKRIAEERLREARVSGFVEKEGQ